MKKHYFLSFLLVLFMGTVASAQVVNGDFENITCNFVPTNWGMTFLQQSGIDPVTGEFFGDEIQYSGCISSMVYVSTDPHSGNYAMEISNAYNVTQDVVIPGIATIFSDPDQSGPGWNPGIPLAPTDTVSLLGFYYKFMPAGDDVAQARIQVMDIDSNEIGHATIDISGTNNEYQYIYQTITYTSSAAPAFMIISFSMAKEGSVPAFGSRLVVDNVVTNFAALPVPIDTIASKIQVYPTLADHELNVSGMPSGAVAYKVINTEGRVVQQNTVVDGGSGYLYSMDVSSLSAGLYFLSIDSALGTTVRKFIKK